ncbi:MAG: sigma 54-interacting transcriptional regulator [Deltaproteobacteria bacterium]|nr:sigma 54-interacting transcriptional regulator [Deltaproteobacteria bacterium]
MDPVKPAVVREQNHLGGKFVAILKICQKINSERDLTALLDLIAVEATKLMEADRATIFLLDQEKHELWSKVALGSEEILRFDSGVGIAGAVVKTGQLINVEDVHRDARFYPAIDTRTRYHTQSLLAVPLRNFEGQTIGAFEVLNKKSGAFTGEDEEILKALAAQATVAIETAQVVGEMARRREQLMQENAQLWREVEGRFSAQNILGNDAKIQSVMKMIKQISDTSVNVLITGESGTGKELVAKAIHYNSPRTRRPFVALNCAALPENLVESELFGIEKGVATGVERRIGKFEMAHGGTLLLDEIGDLSLTAQSKILRVLQERVIERVGGRKAIPVDVRILAATNKDLEEGIKKGSFREDLYYRLKVIHIRMPPLREMREDIPLLANHFLANSCREMDRKPMSLAPQALSSLANYPWPGNVRELENEIKRLVVTVRRKTITEEDLSEAIRSASRASPPQNPTQEPSLKGKAFTWSLQGFIKKIRP